MTPLAIFILVMTLCLAALDAFAERLNQRTLEEPPPPEFGGRVDAAQYRKMLAYQRDLARFGSVHSGVTLAASLAFWLAGGFNAADHLAQRLAAPLGGGAIVTGLIFLALIGLLQAALALPFQLFSTFRIEAHHGFNRTDLKTFILDRVKGTVLAVALGGPLLACLIALFGAAERWGGWAFFTAWAALSTFQLALGLVGPALILPWFYKLKPLDPGPLRESIEAYARAQDFALRDISVMNASKRSAKTNAFFAGAGRFRRLVLFDTLIEKHRPEELLAVVAHEAGHFRLGHIQRSLAFSLATSALLFWLLSVSLGSLALAEAFGMDRVTIHGGLVFFGWLFQPVTRLMSLFSLAYSRKNEFEADAYALKTTGLGRPLAEALMGLALENLSHLTPHRLKVFLEHTHPPVAERIRRLA